jgi:hypothetical protein
MPRQRVPKHLLQNTNSTIGPDSLIERPEHAALIGQSCAAWSYVEAEMAVLLGALLGANSEAAIAVYQTLRRATARVEAVNAAAKTALSPKEKELIEAIFLVHQSAEAERNALSHGCFIAVESMPDAIVWIESSKFSLASVKFHHHPAHAHILGALTAFKVLGEQLADDAFYYTIGDLTSVVLQIKTIRDILQSLISYLLDRPNQRRSRQEKFDRIYNLAPIQEALRVLRIRAQRNNP